MRSNIALILLASLSLVFAQHGGSTEQQGGLISPTPSQNTGASGAAAASTTASGGGEASAGASAAIAHLPKCFTECATKSSTASGVGCTGLSDIGCICSKPQFLNATMVCISSSGQNDCGKLAQNRTALQEGQQAFAGLCKAAGAAAAGGGAAHTNGTNSAGGMPGMSNTTAGGASGHNGGSGHNGAVIQHVATGSIVFTALLAGAATLL